MAENPKGPLFLKVASEFQSNEGLLRRQDGAAVRMVRQVPCALPKAGTKVVPRNLISSFAEPYGLARDDFFLKA